MDYFDAVCMYQEFAVGVQYAEFQDKTKEEFMEEWAVKHGREKILDCMEALLKELDEKKEHYLSIGKIAFSILKRKGL
ncbi:hypothetical protein AGMMS50268_09270 [Spirochaetia bacterium]|nr:hypothetical protein AGMMS50268_09270 [Spirochaetia bacterium]